jgi:hypothetical protein
MIVFFHGLESSPVSDKSTYLETMYDAWCPAMDYTQPGIFGKVLKEAQEKKPTLLIGSSMGGWFAYCISTLTGIPTLLFNPALHGRIIEPQVKRGSKKAKHIMILGKSDDVIDPYKTLSWVKSNGVGTFEHHFENYDHRTPIGIFRKWVGKYAINENSNFITFEQFLNESKKPKGAPDWHDSDAPDADGRFKELGIKDLAAWLIKTRKKDLKKISGSITQQIVFNRKKDPEYAEKMEKVRKEVYKQLGREDLMESRIHHTDQFSGTNSDGEIECEGCGWTWDIVTGGTDPYDCHKCGHDNTPDIDIYFDSQEINI